LIPYSDKKEELLSELQTDENSGLTSEAAGKKMEEFGENKLKEKKKKTTLMRFLDQFKDVMILILIAAAVISFVIACVEKNPKEFFEPALILLIVIVNAVNHERLLLCLLATVYGSERQKAS